MRISELLENEKTTNFYSLHC